MSYVNTHVVLSEGCLVGQWSLTSVKRRFQDFRAMLAEDLGANVNYAGL